MRIPASHPHGARRVVPDVATTPLSQLSPGQRAVVRSVGGDGVLKRRLLEMGFVSGAAVRVVRRAPLADPIEVELHGYHLSLRHADAATVLVEI